MEITQIGGVAVTISLLIPSVRGEKPILYIVCMALLIASETICLRGGGFMSVGFEGVEHKDFWTVGLTVTISLRLPSVGEKPILYIVCMALLLAASGSRPHCIRLPNAGLT